MSRKCIGGELYAQMLSGGAACLAAHIEEINALNVFPVADGDTGTNMAKTISGGLAEISAEDGAGISATSSKFSKGVLLSARGNSGVILSQIFAGINDGLSGVEQADAVALARAYQMGITRSYASVQNPTEGTILTVFRESADYAAARVGEESSIEDFFELHISEARRSLAATKELLPVLAEADVIDSGAAGYVYIAEGMYAALNGDLPESLNIPLGTGESERVDIDSFTCDSELEYGYCTEFLLRLTRKKTDIDSFDVSTVVSELEELGGESIVAYKQDDVVKVHVHTFTPGAALGIAQKYGEFLTVKIENMSLGHSETIKKKAKPSKGYSVLAVASGDGFSALFEDMGADYIVSGGQTSNPSIEEFISVIDSCESEHIMILPNNKNVILAARQAAKLREERNIHVIETHSLAEGYAALSVITPGIKDVSALVASATRAAGEVISCEVTRAVRDARIDGKGIAVGDYIAISGGTVAACEKDPESAVMAALSELDTDLCEMITLFVGKDVDDGVRADLTERIEEAYPDHEVTVHIGGQEVYDYIIAIE